MYQNTFCLNLTNDENLSDLLAFEVIVTLASE